MLNKQIPEFKIKRKNPDKITHFFVVDESVEIPKNEFNSQRLSKDFEIETRSALSKNRIIMTTWNRSIKQHSFGMDEYVSMYYTPML